MGHSQGVGATPSQHAGQLCGVAARTEHVLQRGDVAGVEHKGVVARAAHHDVGAAIANQAVVALPSDKGLCGAGARLGVGPAGAHEVHQRAGGEGTVGAAKNHIAAARIGAAGGVAIGGTHHQVGQAVAIDVARPMHAGAQTVARAQAGNGKAALASGHSRELHRSGGGLAKHHIAATRAAVGPGRANQQVGQAVAVHVAHNAHGETALVGGGLALDDKAAAAGGHIGEVDQDRAGFAKHHIAAARAIARAGVARISAHQHIGQAVAIDVASCAD